MSDSLAFAVPSWVPDGAVRYLAHTEAGRSIRELARDAGCHASTVLRQIRRVETRRDDPLVDAALQALADAHFARLGRCRNALRDSAPVTAGAPDADTVETESIRVLRRLCEAGSVLAVAEDMDRAVVVRSDGNGGSARTAVVDTAIAQALALNEWICCDKPGRISRYRITAAGRTALGQLVAAGENRARSASDSGFAEAQAPMIRRDRNTGQDSGRRRPNRYGPPESPLALLSRRRDRDGQRFLEEELVNAGERLREDFELAQMGPRVAQNWDRFLTGGGREGFADTADTTGSAGDARGRVTRALDDLGPGLSDVVLRCCCYLEGLETAEKRMGWSARSGKIVLRIALQRLKRHYEEQSAKGRMIP